MPQTGRSKQKVGRQTARRRPPNRPRGSSGDPIPPSRQNRIRRSRRTVAPHPRRRRRTRTFRPRCRRRWTS
ncbi:hypothetical protein FOB66_01235 [Roseomonas mucosa]|nr:hypothetical protein FOB66_01235 [Roseomonas mucosa]